jgi:hypothetical protein
VVQAANSSALTGSVYIPGFIKVGVAAAAITDALGGAGTISYQWERGNAGSFSLIPGETGASYTPQVTDEGLYLRVTVTRSGYTGSKTSSAVLVQAAGAVPPTVAGVSVSPSSASVAKGGTLQFNVLVTGTGSLSQDVVWTIVTAGTAPGTGISDTGLLTVASGETLTSLTVRATSTVDTSKSGTATVSITGGTSSGDGTGGISETNVQVYYADGSPYNGNNTVYISLYDGSGTPDYPQVGSITGGLLTFNLPATIDAKYLKSASEDVPPGVIVSPGTLKVTPAPDGLYAGILYINDGGVYYPLSYGKETNVGGYNGYTGIIYMYASGAGTIQGTFTDSGGGGVLSFDITGTAGWNRILNAFQKGGGETYTDDYTSNLGGVLAGSRWMFSGYTGEGENPGPAPTVTGVSVSSSSASVAKGGTLQFSASVTGTGSPSQSVTWTIDTAGTAPGTSISNNGLLTVAASETRTSLTVRAASTVDTSKSGTATVTVTSGGSPGPGTIPLTVSNVTEWQGALTTIQNGGNNKSYAVTLTGSFTTGGVSAPSFGTVTGLTVTLKGTGKLYLTSQGSLLRLNADQTLIIGEAGDAADNPVLEGLKNNQNGANTDNNAPAIDVGNGRLVLNRGTIQNNAISAGIGGNTGGGGVYVNGGSFTMAGGTITGSSASVSLGGGGGVYVNGGSFTMTGGTVTGNSTSGGGGGGGVRVGTNGTFEMAGGSISGNTSGGLTSHGGGVFVAGGTFNMYSGSLISGNVAGSTVLSSGDGGGVLVNSASGTFTMYGGTISNNKANGSGGSGGGVYVSGGTFIMKTGSLISDNKADGIGVEAGGDYGGGGVYVNGGIFTMETGSEISGNEATGGIGVTYPAAGAGGGVYVKSGTYTMKSGSLISGNTAAAAGNNSGGIGGGVYVYPDGGYFAMEGGTISGNEATAKGNRSSRGGGVYVSGKFDMTGGSVSGNTAQEGGGVFVSNNGYPGGEYFTKTGGTIYGDTDNVFGNGSPGDNTATSTVSANLGTNGHAVLYARGYSTYYYRNETLPDNAGGDISTTDPLPTGSGLTEGNWTRR